MRAGRGDGGPMRWSAALALALLGLLAAVVAAAPASAAGFSWSSARFLNQAHQGGEDDVPSNTTYGFADALAHGSDMLEIDVHLSKDGTLVVGHDDSVDRTTDGSGRVQDLTLAQLRRLDAAYWFVPGRSTVHGEPASAYPLRGVRTGKRRPPAGYDREDFRIPTLTEVLAAYPHVPLNVEIKGVDQAEKFRVADALARLLRGSPRRDIVVVSFDQASIDRFHAQAPAIPVAAGVQAAIEFLLLGQELPPGTIALQLPYAFDLGSIGIKLPLVQDLPIELNLAQRWVTDRAHSRGVAVHYWEVPETDAAYRQVLGVCGDGIMTTRPARLEAFLEQAGAPRIGGQGAATDGCPGAPPAPPPGCRVGVAGLVATTGGSVTARIERWGDLRAACSAGVVVRSAEPVVVPGAAAAARRVASRLARRARALERRAGAVARRARSQPRSRSAIRAAGRARSAATTARRRARRASAAARRAGRPRVVTIAEGSVRAPARRMGAAVALSPTADGRALLAAGPVATRTTTTGTITDERLLSLVAR